MRCRLLRLMMEPRRYSIIAVLRARIYPKGSAASMITIESGEAEDKLTEKIDEAVQRGRKNAIWRSQYMKERVMLLDAREEGIVQGIEQSIENMLRNGKSVDEIVDFCGYPYEQVKSVEDSLTVTTK